MAMPQRLRDYLNEQGVAYQLLPRGPAATSTGSAESADVPGGHLVKAVMVEDSFDRSCGAEGSHFALVLLPATLQVHLGEMRLALGDTYALATEDTVRRVFADCDPGPVPPFGEAYGIDVLLDDALLGCERVFMESGDRDTLLAMNGQDFQRLMHRARRGHYGEPA